MRKMRLCLGCVYVSRCPYDAHLVLSHWHYGGTWVVDNNDSLDIGGLRLYDLREYCGALSSTPIAAANFAEPLLTAMLLLNGIMITRPQDQEPLLPVLSHKSAVVALLYYRGGGDSWSSSCDHVMDYFQYKKGQIGASFCALLAIDAGCGPTGAGPC